MVVITITITTQFLMPSRITVQEEIQSDSLTHAYSLSVDRKVGFFLCVHMRPCEDGVAAGQPFALSSFSAFMEVHPLP